MHILCKAWLTGPGVTVRCYAGQDVRFGGIQKPTVGVANIDLRCGAPPRRHADKEATPPPCMSTAHAHHSDGPLPLLPPLLLLLLVCRCRTPWYKDSYKPPRDIVIAQHTDLVKGKWPKRGMPASCLVSPNRPGDLPACLPACFNDTAVQNAKEEREKEEEERAKKAEEEAKVRTNQPLTARFCYRPGNDTGRGFQSL